MFAVYDAIMNPVSGDRKKRCYPGDNRRTSGSSSGTGSKSSRVRLSQVVTNSLDPSTSCQSMQIPSQSSEYSVNDSLEASSSQMSLVIPMHHLNLRDAINAWGYTKMEAAPTKLMPLLEVNSTVFRHFFLSRSMFPELDPYPSKIQVLTQDAWSKAVRLNAPLSHAPEIEVDIVKLSALPSHFFFCCISHMYMYFYFILFSFSSPTANGERRPLTVSAPI
ncbi:hypothetical protein K439DRAFT_673644 [Ramaria rubella]|nr:hypothetical protein K439DRAFT_673644 [Ramaria rubella]